MSDKKTTSTVKNVKDILLSIIAVVTVLATVVAGLYACFVTIDKHIEEAVNNEQFIKKVSSHVRPYVIFNANISILAEGGAMQYIEDIKPIRNEDNKLTGIIITPKEHLDIAPLLESLDEEFAITSKRGNKFQWIYEMDSIDSLALEGSGVHSGINRFRIEIIK